MLDSTLLRYVLLVGGLTFVLIVGHSPRREAQVDANVLTPEAQKKKVKSPYGTPTVVAHLEDKRITESSGLVASRNNPGAYWTHNDSDDGAFIYALGSKGEALGIWKVLGSEADDWEDIAIGPGPQPGKPYIYIGDIGDNVQSRSQIVVYSFPEPLIEPDAGQSSQTKPHLTVSSLAYRFRYPDGQHDAETLLVHPTSGNMYFITKVPLAKPTVYVATPPFDSTKVTVLKKLGDIHIPSIFGGVITGGDISPDGKRVALCDYFQGYEMVLPDGATSFDDIWKQRLVGFDLGKRNQGESIAYRLDGKAVLATSEGTRPNLIQVTVR